MKPLGFERLIISELHTLCVKYINIEMCAMLVMFFAVFCGLSLTVLAVDKLALLPTYQ